MRLDETQKAQKKCFIDALKKNMCKVGNAAKVTGISIRTYYNWRNSDPVFAETVDDIFEEKKDEVEEALFELIKKRDSKAVIFAAKTLCKDRGYKEEAIVNLSADEPFEIKII